ncbi:MAG: hypothetical protein UY92_C0015G0019 [Candidatus Magasanikbacteria bacterium GW2011_GWA2_56_11]|uniref:Uncharacterized protein n=1 Tax=Candidatus Magasanikbacteria bacterium GW2011_GWA2_56_11 TaxID=1619044 RepID=A0A0G2AK61_9BACT|nr:MAG: hypothetical protein UY92_C0015G0019 [Candidatus Magasanikbacteria bacterium GW2011_GWA2_56_11]
MEKAQQIAELKRGIAKYLPVMTEFFDYPYTVAEHAQRLHESSADSEQVLRQRPVAQVVEQYIQRVFNRSVNLQKPLVINIVDHHAPLTHPILLATNIASHIHRLVSDAKPEEPIIVFSSGIVPPNNFLNKKGFHLHDKQISLFSGKQLHQAAFFMSSQRFNFTDRLKNNSQWTEFTPEEQDFLLNFEAELLKIDLSRAQNYADQVSIVNNWIWKKLFAPDMTGAVPELYYIPIEEIFNQGIETALDPLTLTAQTLFTAPYRTRVLHKFDGIAGCWTELTKKGTHFFWLRNGDNIPERLCLDNDKLISEDGATKVSLDKGSLAREAHSRSIIPAMFTLHSWLTFWCGIRPLVGYGSSTYLTRMKEAWLEVLVQGQAEERERIARLDTKGLIGGEILTYKRGLDGKLKEQYALDIIFQGGLSREYLNNLGRMKFSDVLAPALPSIYDSYVPTAEKFPHTLAARDLMSSSFNWIA